MLTEPNTACTIADAVRAGIISARDILERYLARIEAANTGIKAFTFVDAAGARQAADRIDRLVEEGTDPGPLAGVPLGIKDSEECAGMPSCHGSTVYLGRAADVIDSTLVHRARAAGAVPVGKTAVPEFCLHSITASLATGITRNPWDRSLSPGGSSGGSAAAVSSAMVPLATAADGGGSTRSPAAFTGLVGLKPTQGRIPQDTFQDLLVKGCLSLTVGDTARFLDVTAGRLPADRTSLPSPDYSYEAMIERLDVRGLRAAWSADFGFIPTDPECASVSREAAECLIDAARLRTARQALMIPNPSAAWAAAYLVPIRGSLELDGIWPVELDRLTPRVRERLAAVERLGPADLARAARLRAEIERQSAAFFEEVDILMTPATAVVTLPAEGPLPDQIDSRDARATGAEAHLQLANLTWQPAISVPAGLSRAGVPIGLQIIAPQGRDDLVLRLARVLEQVRPWPHLAPAYRPMKPVGL